jgi:hypothetical protein
MRYIVFILLYTSIVVGLTAGLKSVSDSHAAAQPVKAQSQRCEEDMPCWDCKKMGNRKCGVADVVISYDRWGNVTLIQRTRNGKPVLTLFDIDLID